MKILKRNYSHRNLIIFLALSLIYLQAIYSLSSGRSLFSIENFKNISLDQYFIWGLTGITGFMVMKIKKYSQFALLLCLIVIVGKNFILLSDSFNKLTLVLNFIYLVFAFYFFITWELEVGLASYNPHFSTQDLEKESRFKLKANVSSIDGSDPVEVCITNIDIESCFLLMPEIRSIELNPTKKYLLQTTYEGVHFSHTARLVSTYDRGIGLVFEEFSDPRVSWSELYKVCLERGIVA